MKLDNLIILGAGKPLDPNGRGALITEPFTNTTVLDWQLAAARQVFQKITYVAGYNARELEEKYPDLTIVKNEYWETTGPIGSLSCVDIAESENYVIQYGDILLTHYPEELFQNDNSTLQVFYRDCNSVDSRRKERVCFLDDVPIKFGYDAPNIESTFELCGLVSCQGSIARCLTNVSSLSNKDAPLSFIPEMQRITGGNLNCIPIGPKWIEINNEQDFAKQLLGTKAETLHRLEPVLKKSFVLDQVLITHEDWLKKRFEISSDIIKKFLNSKLIVRSSALSEDGFESAFAGVYDSILNVDCDLENICKAVDNVFASYSDSNSLNQVLVQPMLETVKISGVAFTRSIDNGAPYITINYDDHSGLTDTVTGGAGHDLSVIKVFKHNADKAFLNTWQSKLLDAIFEIEAYVNLDALDIEFAVDADGEICIFQVRPIASIKDNSKYDDDLTDEQLYQAVNLYEQFAEAGQQAVFAKMPDWNPAEIIGTRPDVLSYSLYSALITDRVWAKQRHENGNIDLRGEQLMQLFCGQPFINVKKSITSFIPAGLGNDLNLKIISRALSIYKENPHFHDKLEFEVVPTCIDLNPGKWKSLYVDANDALTPIEFDAWFASLKQTTSFQVEKFHLYKQMALEFNTHILELYERSLPVSAKIRKTLHLLEEIGTLSFAHLARCGFIAISILRTAAKKYPNKAAIIEKFQSNIKTVSTRYTHDLRSFKLGEISEADFVEAYGHLRPSTYNIYSKAYKNNLNTIIPNNVPNIHLQEPFEDNGVMIDALEEFAGELEISVEKLMLFISGAIHWREESKFIFSKGLSYILELLAETNPSSLYTDGLIHHFTIDELLSILDGQMSRSQISELAGARSKIANVQAKIELPEVITNSSEFRIFKMGNHEFNFIGSGSILSELVELNVNSTDQNLNDKIVLIESADPGYDWIFGHKIAGLITEYGGANSHMAIRAAEYNIPAAIGIGTKAMEKIRGSERVEIDCKSKILRSVT